MRLTLLGTTSMMPTRERAHSAHFLEYKGDGILFDCGEGTQRQILLAGINRQKTKIVCLSHWHGDHAAGLVAFLQSVTRDQPPGTAPIQLIGPPGSAEHYHHLSRCMATDTPYNVEVQEINAPEVTLVLKAKDYQIHARNLEHAIPTLGFSFTEISHRNIDKEWMQREGIPPGPHLRALKEGQAVEVAGRVIRPEEATYPTKTRKFAYVADTRCCPGTVEIARGADLLLCEATHLQENAEKAHAHFHLTARQAAEIARDAGAEQLVLTHFSQRYPNTLTHVAEAQAVFPNAMAGEDFLQVEITK
ncbi:MAG: ribonuclease Z [Bacteroidota bacterium]